MTYIYPHEGKRVRDIKEFTGQHLVWEKPRAMSKEFELRAGEEVLATLKWSKGWWSTLAEAASAGGKWTFKRSGFLKSKTTARLPGSESDLATFEQNWRGAGILQLSSGSTYRWEKDAFWGARFAWKDATGNPLVRFRYRALKSGEVEVTPSAASVSDLPLLVVLGWYVLVSSVQESVAAGGSGGAAAAAAGG